MLPASKITTSRLPRPALSATALLTRHAQERCQQRSMPAEVLEWLLDHGVYYAAGAGTELIILNAPTRQSLGGQIGRLAYARYDRKLSRAYVLVGADGRIITVGHRTRSLKRH